VKIRHYSVCCNNNINGTPTDNDDRHKITADKTTNVHAHFATLFPAPPCHVDEFFDYKSKLIEIDDAINMMKTWMTTTNVNGDDHHNDDRTTDDRTTDDCTTDDRNNDDSSNKDCDNDNRKNDDRDTEDCHHDDRLQQKNTSQMVSTSDPPVATEPDRTSFLKELDAQHNSQLDSTPPAMKRREVEPTHTVHISDTTRVQLWNVLVQLEDINKQFARWLDTLTMEKPTTTPDNTPGNQMIPLDTPTATTPALNPNQMIPLDAPTATTPAIIQSTPAQHNKQPAYIFFATRDNEPTGGIFLLQSPLDRHSPNVRPPPWPPPMSQMKGPNHDLSRNHTQITNLLPTPDARLFRLMLHRHNPIWPSPIPRRTCALLNCT